MKFKLHSERRLRHWFAGPFIWGMVIPLVILDVFLEIYHRICFPLYSIPLVKRRNYIKIDRKKLEYLNLFEKVACSFCGYANGLFAYAVRIAGDSEKYWCSIKHAKKKGFHEPEHHKEFLEYGDKETFNKLFKVKR